MRTLRSPRRGAWLAVAAVLLLALPLAACGRSVVAVPGVSAHATATRTTTTTATTTATSAATEPSGATPPASTATTGAVTLSHDQAHYGVSATIQVTIQNGLAGNIYAMDHGTGCTVLRLQRWVNGAWANTAECALMTVTRFVLVQTGTTVVRLTPGKLQPHPAPWTPGTYRVTLAYLTQPDATPGLPTLVSSSSFTIG